MTAPSLPSGVWNTGRGRAVAEAPDQALHPGRHQFPVLAQQRAVRSEEQRGAIERADVALDDADDQVQAVLLRGGTEAVHSRGRHIDGAFKVTAKLTATFRSAASHARPEIQPLGITRNERFWEDNELGAARGRLRRQRHRLFNACLAVKRNSPRLHHRDSRVGHGSSLVRHSKHFGVRKAMATRRGARGRGDTKTRSGHRQGHRVRIPLVHRWTVCPAPLLTPTKSGPEGRQASVGPRREHLLRRQFRKCARVADGPKPTTTIYSQDNR